MFEAVRSLRKRIRKLEIKKSGYQIIKPGDWYALVLSRLNTSGLLNSKFTGYFRYAPIERRQFHG